MLLILLLLVLASSIGTVNCQCWTAEDKSIGDLCYTISGVKLNFADARNHCAGYNKNLAVIHTTTQSNFLASLVRTQTGAPEGLFWIGLSRPAVGSRFQWDDGTAMYWSNFDGSFPQDNNFAAESTVNGKWRTLDGLNSLYFVCSYSPNVAPVTGTTTQSTTQSTTPAEPMTTTEAEPTYYTTSGPSDGTSTFSSSTGYPTDTPSTYPPDCQETTTTLSPESTTDSYIEDTTTSDYIQTTSSGSTTRAC